MFVFEVFIIFLQDKKKQLPIKAGNYYDSSIDFNAQLDFNPRRQKNNRIIVGKQTGEITHRKYKLSNEKSA